MEVLTFFFTSPLFYIIAFQNTQLIDEYSFAKIQTVCTLANKLSGDRALGSQATSFIPTSFQRGTTINSLMCIPSEFWEELTFLSFSYLYSSSPNILTINKK